MTETSSSTDYLPDEITYGFVADRVLLAVGDTNRDFDRYPDGVPAQGTVRFSPQRTILYTQQRPATVLPQDIECTIYYRDHPVALENGYEPELVGKLVDPAGHVGNVALIVGWYDVVYRLSTGTAQRFRFQVRPEHTADNPLWLPEVAPLQPTPSERFVVNEQVYNETKEARDQAEQYRDTTRTLRNETETYRDQAEGYRDEAGQSATSAAEILSDVQDLGITVDTSVGTRVFVGDVMIHGDTGWRDVSDLLPNDLVQSSSANANLPPIIRRVGSTVSLEIYVDILSGERRSVLQSIPSGFRPNQIISRPGTLYTSTNIGAILPGTIQSHYISSSGVNTAQPLPSPGTAMLTASWQTTDPWPSSLPGLPV